MKFMMKVFIVKIIKAFNHLYETLNKCHIYIYIISFLPVWQSSPLFRPETEKTEVNAAPSSGETKLLNPASVVPPTFFNSSQDTR